MKGCKYLDSKQGCPYGCSEAHSEQTIMCHRFHRGTCRYRASNCPYGMHYPLQPRGDGSQTTPIQPRGDRFRPHLPDTAMEIELKKHLSILMLSSKCEDLLDLDVGILEKWYRILTLIRHPDKSSNGASNERFVQLHNAMEYVKEKLPFSMTVP